MNARTGKAKLLGRTVICVLAMLAFSASRIALGQELPQSLLDCTKERNDAKRLACFDRETENVIAPKDVKSTDVKSTTHSPTSRRTPEQEFGYRGTVAREEMEKREAAQPKEITAGITALTTHLRGEYTLTLDNGQIWTQKEASKSIQLKVGDRVTLKRGALGAIWLITPDGRSTAVTRNR